MGVANEDDVTSSIANNVSSLRVTCDGGGSDVSACVEMVPAAGGVDSDDDNDRLS